MKSELNRSSLVGGNKPVATYSRDGLEIATSPINEFVVFRKITINQNQPFYFIYPESDLRIVSIQSDQQVARYRVEVQNLLGTRIYSSEFAAQIYEPPTLIVPKGFKCLFIPVECSGNFSIIACQVSVIDTVILE